MAGLAGCTGGDQGDGSGGGGSGGDGSGTLEIVHWWTAGGEKQALNALLDGFKEKHSDVQVNNNPAPGGAGSALDAVVKNRVLNQNPPSTFQIWPGDALKPYTDSDVLQNIGDNVWTEEMRNAYLPGPKNAAKPAGQFVAVPINIHRLNNLFYNTAVLEQAGVDPSSIRNPQGLVDALDTIAQETDAVPMAHSTQDSWPTLQLWETVFIGEQGPDAYVKLTEEGTDPAQFRDGIRSALRRIDQYRQHFNQDAGSISWDQANGKIVDGQAAMIHQGDWAAGQYVSAENFNYEGEWNMVPFPGTQDTYSIVMDSFVFPKNNPSPDATRKFLSYCGTVDAQRRFNPVKGSIPPRKDVPTDPFGPFLTSQMEDFQSANAQPPTIAHGSAVPPEVKSSMEETFAAFNGNWNVDRTTQGIVDALRQ
ncbi:ABC transporter substrate-binding protein [Halegenticoccus soli]|uniref:ABC transporter substrate-binding protein n=1 Tax=Halegenticoccus soli TaxID=1985678 RepID=UPI002FCE3880